MLAKFGVLWVIPSTLVELSYAWNIVRFHKDAPSCSDWVSLPLCGAYGGNTIINSSRILPNRLK